MLIASGTSVIISCMMHLTFYLIATTYCIYSMPKVKQSNHILIDWLIDDPPNLLFIVNVEMPYAAWICVFVLWKCKYYLSPCHLLNGGLIVYVSELSRIKMSVSDSRSFPLGSMFILLNDLSMTWSKGNSSPKIACH